MQVVPARGVTKIQRKDDEVEVCLEDGSILTGDAIIAGLGINPNTELAFKAGLNVGNGIVVDECLRTSYANIYAAGDVANFPCPALNKRVRLEHEDNANSMGLLAGRNMAGGNEPYRYLPYFYSDMFDIGYEAVGEIVASHRAVIEWVEPNQKGVIFYLMDMRVRGVLFWNIFGKLDAARNLISSPDVCHDQDLKTWTKENLSK